MATRASMDRSAGQTLPAAVLDSIVTGVISTETATPTVLVGEGSHWARTDLDEIILRNGTGGDETCGGYGPWKTFVPTAHNGAGVTIPGLFSATGRYRFVAARTIQFFAVLTSLSTGPGSGLQFALPFGMVNQSDAYGFSGAFNDVGVGLYSASGTIGTAAGLAQIAAVNTAGTYASLVGVSSTVPFSWVAGDLVYLGGIYECGLA